LPTGGRRVESARYGFQIADTGDYQLAPYNMPEPKSDPRLDRVRHELRASGVPLKPPGPLRSGIHSRGYLPHVKREGAAYFVTFRLVDSLPQEVTTTKDRASAATSGTIP